MMIGTHFHCPVVDGHFMSKTPRVDATFGDKRCKAYIVVFLTIFGVVGAKENSLAQDKAVVEGPPRPEQAVASVSLNEDSSSLAESETIEGEKSILLAAARAFSKGDEEAAGQLLSAWLAANPTDPGGLDLQAKMLERVGKKDEAFGVLQLWVKAHPGHLLGRMRLADALAERGNLTEAIEHYGYIVQRQPGFKDAVVRLVYAFAALGDLPTAGQWLARLDPDDVTHPGFYFGRAAIEFARGDEAAVDQILSRARTLYGGDSFMMHEPRFLQALRAILRVREHRGQP